MRSPKACVCLCTCVWDHTFHYLSCHYKSKGVKITHQDAAYWSVYLQCLAVTGTCMTCSYVIQPIVVWTVLSAPTVTIRMRQHVQYIGSVFAIYCNQTLTKESTRFCLKILSVSCKQWSCFPHQVVFARFSDVDQTRPLNTMFITKTVHRWREEPSVSLWMK